MSYRVTQSKKSLEEFKKAITDAKADTSGLSHVYEAATNSPYAYVEVDDSHPGVTFEYMYMSDWQVTTPAGKQVIGAQVVIARVDPAALQRLNAGDNPRTQIAIKQENGDEFTNFNHSMLGQSEIITLLKTVKVHEDPVGAEQGKADVILQISGPQQIPLDALTISSKHGVIKDIHQVFSNESTHEQIEQYFRSKGLTRPGSQSDEYLKATLVEGQFHADPDKMQALSAMSGNQALRESGYVVGGQANGRPFADTYVFVEGFHDANKNGKQDAHETQKTGIFLVGKGEDIYTDDCKPAAICIAGKLTAHLLEGADRDHWNPHTNNDGKSGVVHKSFFASSFVMSQDGRSVLNQVDVQNTISKLSVKSDSDPDPKDNTAYATLDVVYKGDESKVFDGKTLSLHRYDVIWKTIGVAPNIIEGQFETNSWELRLRDGKKIQLEAVVKGNVDRASDQEHTVTENDPVLGGVHDEEIEEVDGDGMPVTVPNVVNPQPVHGGRSRRSAEHSEPSSEQMEGYAIEQLFPRGDDLPMVTEPSASAVLQPCDLSGGTDLLTRLLGEMPVAVI